jgi:hypothetical protein
MTYKQWINELSPRHLLAFGCQCGVNGWNNLRPEKLRAALVKSERGRELYASGGEDRSGA